MPSSSKAFFVYLGLSAAVAGAAAYYALKSKASGSAPDDGMELAPALTEDEAVEIMKNIYERVRMVAVRMAQAAEGIKAQLAQQGQEMDDRKLMKTFIYQHFVDQLEQIQGDVLTEFDAEEVELEDAVTTYQSTEAQLKEYVQKIKALNYQFGGDDLSTSETEDGTGHAEPLVEMSIDEVVEVIGTLTERINDAMDDFINEFKEQHGEPDQSALGFQFQFGLMQLTEKIEKEVIENTGISQVSFQKSIETHSTHPRVQEAFMRMQMNNGQKLAEHGIQMGQQ